MPQFEDKHLDFVTRHYKEGTFDTRKALERFNSSHGIQSQKPRVVRLRVVSVAAAAAVVILGILLFHQSSLNTWNELMAESEIITGLLPDSTSVTLAPGSTLRYRYFKGESREVEMTGKIYFDVARDESRPFEITTGNAYIKVLGTSFQVDATVASNKAVKVDVLSGKVLFARSEDVNGVVLTKGMGATLANGAFTPVLDTKSNNNAIAWQRGTFIFDNTPLKDVLNTLAKHYKVSFVCNDLSKNLSGEFSTEDLDTIITLIEEALGVNILKID